MIRYADVKLGQLIGELEALDLRDKTIIVWTSDNGSPAETTAMFRGHAVAGGPVDDGVLDALGQLVIQRDR